MGFLAIATFLGVNGHELDVTDADVITHMIGLAAGNLSEDDLAAWIRAHVKRGRKQRSR